MNQYINKSNVLYVVPRYETYGNSGHYVMPLGILYVSSYVKQANVANVFTLNLNHEEGEEYDTLCSSIRQNDIQIIGIGGLSGEYRDVARMVKYARQIRKDIVIMVGGGIVTADPYTAMEALNDADIGIIGEGEITSVELLKVFSRDKDISLVNGIIYRSNNELICTPKREEILNLDSLPFPDYEGFNYHLYLEQNPDVSDEGKIYTPVSIVGGRSCKYNCTFCFHPSGSVYRQRSLDSIFKEIDYLVGHYQITYIALREELFATDNERVADFCKRMGKYDVDWSIQLRIDCINEELVALLKDTRCRYVFVGIESADNTVLKSMRKGITLEHIEKALDMLKKTGLKSRSGLIFGDTVETFGTAVFSLNWFDNNRSKYRMFVDMIIAFPGSTLYKRAVRNGVIPDKVRFLKDGCPIVNVSAMDNEEFSQLISLVEERNSRKYHVKYY